MEHGILDFLSYEGLLLWIELITFFIVVKVSSIQGGSLQQNNLLIFRLKGLTYQLDNNKNQTITSSNCPNKGQQVLYHRWWVIKMHKRTRQIKAQFYERINILVSLAVNMLNLSLEDSSQQVPTICEQWFQQLVSNRFLPQLNIR